MEPLVSVIMSTLNTPIEYLKESINSILTQTYKNIEFIIIIDGGNDDKYIRNIEDERIKIVKHEMSIGLTKSLNEAIKMSRGKYIARMDSDDISLITRIKTQVEYMEKNEDIDIVAMFYKEIGKNKKNVREVFYRPEEVKCKLFFTNLIAHPSVMIRKSFLDKNNLLYNEKFPYSQDLELWTRAINYGKIAIIPKFGLLYRIHDKQISSEKSNKQMELYYSILVRNLQELNIEEEKLKYLLMLNGKKTVENKDELRKFIALAIDKNKSIKKYNEKKFKNILKIYYGVACLKSHKIFLPTLPFFRYIMKKMLIFLY